MWATKPEISVKVFISYAHADREWHRKLENHLSLLIYSGEITLWHYQEIPAGANQEAEFIPTSMKQTSSCSS